MTDKIKKFTFWTNVILPLVYDDSLSYYECLQKFNAKLTEVITQVNALTDAQKEFVELVADAVDKFTDAVNSTLNKWQLSINDQIDNWNDYINQQLNDSHLQSIINNKINQLIQNGTFTDMIFNSNAFQTWLKQQETSINNYFNNVSQELMDVYSITKLWTNPTAAIYPKNDVNPINLNLLDYDFINVELLYGVDTQSVLIAKGSRNQVLSTSSDPDKNYLAVTEITYSDSAITILARYKTTFTNDLSATSGDTSNDVPVVKNVYGWKKITQT